MPKFTYNRKEKNEFERELLRYKEFLNFVIGAFSFNLAFVSLGTQRPQLSAIICIFFVMLLISYGSRHYPKTLLRLKKNEKLGEAEELILIGLHKKHFGFPGLFRNFSIFFVGFLSLSSVFIYGESLKNFF